MATERILDARGNVLLERELVERDPMPDLRSDALARLAAIRWEATQFFTYNGVRTQADGAIAVVTAAVVARQAFNVTTPQTWKIAPGVFVALDTPALLDFGQALQTHVQSCFDNEAALSAQIASARTPEALAAIDITRGWP